MLHLVAKKLATYIIQNNIKPPKLFLQVNIGEEKQKRGISISQIGGFLIMCREKYKLVINGAMCMPPKNKKPEEYFRKPRIDTRKQGQYTTN